MGRERMSCTGSKAGAEEAVGRSRMQPVGRQVLGGPGEDTKAATSEQRCEMQGSEGLSSRAREQLGASSAGA